MGQFEQEHETVTKIQDSVSTIIRSNNNAIRWLLASFFAGGHVLLEDVPGTGKTTLAKALAGSIDADFKRIQFTPDLLPTDILGVSIYDQTTQDFRFREGPIFTQILLADEINRASPRTQSALLEAMGENQVSIEGDRIPLHDLFFVVATQNPVEFHGTYPLPEAQMDRFAMRFNLGYVSIDDEIDILVSQQFKHPLEDLSPVALYDDLMMVKQAISNIRISDELKRYIVEIVAATRSYPSVQMGASPRASITLMKTAQALALLDNQEYVTPEVIQELTVPVIAHRLALEPDARFSGLAAEEMVVELVNNISVPA